MGFDWPLYVLAANCVVDLMPQGGSQCFPFYTYAEDGTNRRENITDWALDQFRSYYKDQSIPNGTSSTTSMPRSITRNIAAPTPPT